jgi:hypothetical protein
MEFDMLTHAAQHIALTVPSGKLDLISSGFARLRALSPTGQIRIASACSGSGMGDVSLNVLTTTLSSMIAVEPDCLTTVFACEANPKKAQFLIDTLDVPLVFDDVRSADPTQDTTMNDLRTPPPHQAVNCL